MKLYFFQCQESYGNSIYLPYSSGILWAYVRQFEIIKNNYVLGDIFFEKLPVKDYESKVTNPDILLFSNYGWNTTYHLEIAKRFKQLHPNVKIIIGGPNAQQQESYLREHNYIDYSVWGEGEQSLLELLSAIANNSNIKDVPGIAYVNNDQYNKTTTRVRKTELKELPSPYLEGVFDDYFVRYPNYNFMPVWETHRGCPYHCTFCDLGSDYYNKVYMFETDRLLKEIDWFSEHKIEYVEVADANFGIFPRDLDLVKYIKHKHSENGFPEKINATWAKNSPERLFEMSKILDTMNRGGMTLALQSQSKPALSNIKRINIANDQLEDITRRYIESNIPTYHDFILGLPGETLDSWIQGLNYIVDINPEGWIFGHPLEAYENTEFSDTSYIEKHSIKFAYTPQVSFYAYRNKELPIEIGKYVIETNTLTNEDYVECFMYKWFLVTMHSLGWANIVSKKLTSIHNLGQSVFYQSLYNYMKTSDNIIKKEYDITKDCLKNTLDTGTFWGRQIFGNNDFYWEYESASAIMFEYNRDEYFKTLKQFINDIYGSEYVKDVDLNDHSLISYNRQYPYNTDDFRVSGTNYNNFNDFCKAIYHKGRRLKKWKTKLTAIQSGAHSKK